MNIRAITLSATLLAVAGCGGNSSTDAGSDSTAGDGGSCTSALPADFFPAPAPPFGPTDDVPGSVQVSLSGEALAEMGYDYTSTPPDASAIFVDGWELRYQHLYVVVGSVRLNDQGADPTMRGSLGAAVAQRTGPWIVDLHAHGPISGAGGPPETAVPLFVWTGPDAGGAFDTSRRYAFSFETTAATTCMQNVNLVAGDMPNVQRMIDHHWTELIVATATYRGRVSSATVDATFQSYPTGVSLDLGMGIPSQYLNCHNPEIGSTDVPANRGIQPSATGHTRAQITMHTDHTFWDQLEVEGTFYHLDPFIARSSNFGMSGASVSHVVTMDDLMGESPTALVDHATPSAPVLNRADQTTGYDVTMDHAPPTYDLNGVSTSTVTDLRDFVAYTTRSQGHLNSDGLCLVVPTGPFAY